MQYEALATDREHDNKIAVYLSIILPALCGEARKLFKDPLPGGCWEKSSEEIIRNSTRTQKHNKCSESVFGFLDKLLRKTPNTSVLSSEAYIMSTANKTKQWLESKDPDEQQCLVHVTNSCTERQELKY